MEHRFSIAAVLAALLLAVLPSVARGRMLVGSSSDHVDVGFGQ